MKYILKNINFINIILITAIVLFANYAVLPLLKTGIKYTPVDKEIAKNKGEELPVREGLPYEDYTIIAKRNLFHPERIIPAESSIPSISSRPVEKKAEIPISKPEIVLYGTVVSGGINLAYIEDIKSPLKTPGRGNRLRIIKRGEMIRGFILKEIEPDKITLVRGKEKMTVNLSYPPKKRKPAPSLSKPKDSKPKQSKPKQ